MEDPSAACNVDTNPTVRAPFCTKARYVSRRRFTRLLDERTSCGVPFSMLARSATIWGCQAGKDVYVNQFAMVFGKDAKWSKLPNNTAESFKQVPEPLRRWLERSTIRTGNIGEIKMVRGLCYRNRESIGKIDSPLVPPESVDYDMWLGPAEHQELYRPRFHYDWHWDFNTGNGDLGNQGPHELDLMRWILGDPDHPLKVQSLGGRFGWNDAGNTPNMGITTFNWGGVPAIFEVRNLWVKPR